ncbi:hypothetical protein D3C75_391810 [compost metagenome]
MDVHAVPAPAQQHLPVFVRRPLQRRHRAVFLALGIAQKAVVDQVVVHDRAGAARDDVFITVGQAVVEGEAAGTAVEHRGIAGVQTEALLPQRVAVGILVAGVAAEAGRVVPLGTAVEVPRGDAGQAVVHHAVGIGVPRVDAQVDQLAVRVEPVAQAVAVHIDVARVPLRDAVTFDADDLRGHDLASGAFIATIAGFQCLRIVDAPGALEQGRFRTRGRVQHFGTRRVQRGQGATGLREVVVALAAGKVIAVVAVCIGGHQVEAIPVPGSGHIEELAAGGAAIAARHGLVAGQVVGAAVGQSPAHAYADIAPLAQHVIDIQGFHFDHAADTAGGIGLQARALGDGQPRDQVGVEVGALRLAGIATVSVHAGLATVDDDRHPALALDAADVDVEAIAHTWIASGNTGHALDDVAVGGAAEPLQCDAANGGGRAHAAIAVEQARFITGGTTTNNVAGHAQRVGDDDTAAGLHRRCRFQGDRIGADPAHCHARALQQVLQRLAGRQAATDRARGCALRQRCGIHHLHAGLAHVAAQCFVQGLRRDVEALHGSVVAAGALRQYGGCGTGKTGSQQCDAQSGRAQHAARAVGVEHGEPVR